MWIAEYPTIAFAVNHCDRGLNYELHLRKQCAAARWMTVGEQSLNSPDMTEIEVALLRAGR